MNNQKKLSFTSLLIAVFTSVVGAGIYFKLPKMLTATKGNINAVLLAWLIGGAIVLSIGLIFAEIFSDEETARGGFVKLGESIFGRKFAFAITWSTLLFYMTLVGALVAQLCISFLFTALKIKGSFMVSMLILFLAIVLLVILFIVNFVSIEFSKITNAIIVMIKLIPLVAVIISGLLFKGDYKELGHAFSSTAANSGGTFALATSSLPMIIFSLEGWIFPASLAADAKDPTMQWPLAFISGIILAVVVYILFSLGNLNIINISTWKDPSNMMGNISKTLVQAFHSTTVGKLLFYILSISLLGTTNAIVQSVGRSAATLSDDNMFPSIFSKRNKSDLPMNSALLALGITVSWIIIGALLIVVLPKVFAELEPGKALDLSTQDFSAGLDTLSNWVVVLFFVYYMTVIVSYAVKRSTMIETKGFKIPNIVFYVLVVLSTGGALFAMYSTVNKDNYISLLIVGILYFSGFLFHKFFDKGTNEEKEEITN